MRYDKLLNIEAEQSLSPFHKPGFSHAPILIISLSSQHVKDFLTQHILSSEGFTLAVQKKDTDNNPFAYRFSNITSLAGSENLHFPTLSQTEKSVLYLRNEIAQMPNLKAIITLGITAHHATLNAYHLPIAHMGHLPGILQTLPDGMLLTHARHIPENFIKHKTHLPERLKPLRQVLAILRTKLK